MNLEPLDSRTLRAVPQEGVDAAAVLSDDTIRVAAQTVAPLLRNGVDVTTAPAGSAPRGAEQLPELDKSLNGKPGDVEKLIALLTLESDERQIAAAKDRLNALLDRMDEDQKKVLQQLARALEETKKVEERQKRQAALGWLTFGLSIIACVITSVATFGAGSAGAFAIAACVCSIASTTLGAVNQILTAAGVKEKRVQARAEQIQKKEGCTKQEATEKAEKEWNMGWGIATGVLGVASLLCGIGSIVQSVRQAGQAAAKLAEETAKTTGLASKGVQTGLQIAGSGVQAVTLGVNIGQTVLAFDLAKYIRDQQKASAKLAELQGFLDKIQQAMEEEQDRLKQLLTNFQGAFEVLSMLLASPSESMDMMLSRFNSGASV